MDFLGQKSGISDTNVKIETNFMQFPRDSGKNWTGISVALSNFDWDFQVLIFSENSCRPPPLYWIFSGRAQCNVRRRCPGSWCQRVACYLAI